MSYPEPSRRDHDAPWNQEDFINEDGEDDTRCGCSSCTKARKEADKEDSGYYDNQWKEEGF